MDTRAALADIDLRHKYKMASTVQAMNGEALELDRHLREITKELAAPGKERAS